MTDLTKGIIEINGFTFSPKTTLDEVVDFFGENIRVVDLSLGPKAKFLERFYVSDDIYSYSFQFNKDKKISSFDLCPAIPENLEDPVEVAKYKLEASKQWLKGMIEGAAFSECERSILYTYVWGDIDARITNDIHYGLVGGEIIITYKRG